MCNLGATINGGGIILIKLLFILYHLEMWLSSLVMSLLSFILVRRVNFLRYFGWVNDLKLFGFSKVDVYVDGRGVDNCLSSILKNVP